MPAGFTNVWISYYDKKTVLTMHRYYVVKWGFPNIQTHISESEIFEVEQQQS